MYTKESFCNHILKKKYETVKEIVLVKPYITFSIPKKNGNRIIHYLENNSELALLQKNLQKNFLAKQPLPVCVKGFRKNESYNSFLYPHIGAKYYLRIDIKNFFPSIKSHIIKREMGNIINIDSKDNIDDLLDLICQIVTLDNCLPQGAYTSPTISNLVMARVDQRILKYCQALDIKYTRYADDLLFSSTDFNFKDKDWFLKKIKHIISSNELKLNYTKLKYSEKEMVLNGYVISENGIRLSRKKLHDIRKVLSFVKTNYPIIKASGTDSFLSNLNKLDLKYRNLGTHSFTNIFKVIQYMNGNRAFLISFINNDYENCGSQKEIRKLINKIEILILKLSKAL